VFIKNTDFKENHIIRFGEALVQLQDGLSDGIKISEVLDSRNIFRFDILWFVGISSLKQTHIASHLFSGIAICNILIMIYHAAHALSASVTGILVPEICYRSDTR